MIKFGQVTAYDQQTGMATIHYSRPEACEKCGACGGKTHEGTITLKADCAEGDWVKVELPDGKFLHATFIAYVIPLVLFFVGLFLGYQMSGGNEGIALAASLAGLGLSFLLLRLNDRRIAGKPEWTPRVTQVYDHRPEQMEPHCDNRA
ncbi:MAG: SoxR reducing system RseC family protein [Eubacteriales bacterium]|nr:SoxR reducing system RseC family protein [Eubacteriales bacterium]